MVDPTPILAGTVTARPPIGQASDRKYNLVFWYVGYGQTI